MRKHLLKRLVVEDAEEPVVWAHTLQPLQVTGGWRLNDKMSDGCIYIHPKWGIASLRGIEDDQARKWLHLAMVPATGSIGLGDVQDLRNVFFPPSAIVAMAIEPKVAEVLHMWWSVDEKGLPMDPDWKAMVLPEENRDG